MTKTIKHESAHDGISTKQKIVTCAVNLFAMKGYTETTIRELADAVGVKGASIYNHFPSKNAILEYIMADYVVFISGTFDKDVAFAKLRENPTADGIMGCFNLHFPEGTTDYYLKVICVFLQEQYRNPVIHDFVASQHILQAEHDAKAIFLILKELNVIREDTDIDPWVKTLSSLLYTFSSRMALGMGDASPDFSGKGLVELFRFHIDLMLSICAVKAPERPAGTP